MLASPIHRAIWARLEQSGELVTRGEARARERENAVAARELGLPSEESMLRVVTPGLHALWPLVVPTVSLLAAATLSTGLPGFAFLGAGLIGLGSIAHLRHARRQFVTSHRVLTRRRGRWVVLEYRESEKH